MGRWERMKVEWSDASARISSVAHSLARLMQEGLWCRRTGTKSVAVGLESTAMLSSCCDGWKGRGVERSRLRQSPALASKACFRRPARPPSSRKHAPGRAGDAVNHLLHHTHRNLHLHALLCPPSHTLSHRNLRHRNPPGRGAQVVDPDLLGLLNLRFCVD